MQEGRRHMAHADAAALVADCGLIWSPTLAAFVKGCPCCPTFQCSSGVQPDASASSCKRLQELLCSVRINRLQRIRAAAAVSALGHAAHCMQCAVRTAGLALPRPAHGGCLLGVVPLVSAVWKWGVLHACCACLDAGAGLWQGSAAVLCVCMPGWRISAEQGELDTIGVYVCTGHISALWCCPAAASIG